MLRASPSTSPVKLLLWKDECRAMEAKFVVIGHRLGAGVQMFDQQLTVHKGRHGLPIQRNHARAEIICLVTVRSRCSIWL